MEDCITIESSDEDDAQVTVPPVTKIEQDSRNVEKRRVLLKTSDTGKSVFTQFLNACKAVDSSNDMDLIVNKMWKKFHQADASYTSSLNFINFVKNLTKGVFAEPYSQLKLISDELKFHTIKSKKCSVEPNDGDLPCISSDAVKVGPKTRKNIKKLEKIIEKLHEKIADLESQEVDLNNSSDEEDSAYLQVCRYKKRICDVFRKLSELRKTTPIDDCIQSNIKFSGTKIPAVNRAIEKFYNDTRNFPDYRDVLTIVEKANDLKHLKLSLDERRNIATKAFRELGESLKKMRQFEFHSTLSTFIADTSDPASQDTTLEEKLAENQKLYGNRIDEIIDKYAQKQSEENLQPVEVSDDALSETDGGEDELEEEDGDDSSSIAVIESNDEHDSINEDCIINEDDYDNDDRDPDNRGRSNDRDADEKAAFKLNDIKIVLPDVQSMPEWSKYQAAARLLLSSSSRASSLKCGNEVTGVCSPIAGCSKDITNDFCLPCSTKELSSSTKRRLGASFDESDDGEDESSTKKAKFIEPTSPTCVDLTIVSSEAKNVEYKTESRKRYESSDLSYVFIDTEANIDSDDIKNQAASPTNHTENVEDPIAFVDAVRLPDNEVSSEKSSETFCKNGIKIVSVSSKNASSKVESGALKSSKEPKNFRTYGSSKGKGTSTNACDVKTANVIDLEKIPDLKTRFSKATEQVKKSDISNYFTKSPSTSSTLTTNSSPSFSDHSSQTKTDNQPQPPWQRFSMTNHRFSATSTPKPNMNQIRMNTRFTPPYTSPMPHMQRTGNSFNPRIMNARSTSHSARMSSQRFMRGTHSPNRYSAPGSSNRGLPFGARAAMAQRTMQTTQKFVHGNNLFTQTTTVVQESVLQLPNLTNNNGNERNNFNAAGSSNRAGGNRNNHHRFPPRTGNSHPRVYGPPSFGPTSKPFPQKPFTRPIERKNSAGDVITLD